MNIYELAEHLHAATGGDLRQTVDAVIRATAMVILDDYAPDGELGEWADEALHDVRTANFDEDQDEDDPIPSVPRPPLVETLAVSSDVL